jgi:hypothetical protein
MATEVNQETGAVDRIEAQKEAQTRRAQIKRPKFQVQSHADWDKEIVVVGPNDLMISVDYDDVDHKQVEKDIRKMVEILNTYW